VAAGEINAFDNGGQTNAVGSAVCNPAGNTSSCATVVGRYKLNSALLGVQYNHRF
jgi:long-chain fatty acid transport protein